MNTASTVVRVGRVIRLGNRSFVAVCAVCWGKSPAITGTARGAARWLRRLGWMERVGSGAVVCPDCVQRGKAIEN